MGNCLSNDYDYLNNKAPLSFGLITGFILTYVLDGI